MMPSLAFHVYLYGPGGTPLGTRFDEVSRQLMRLQRLHFEPDGSLLWTGERWQIGGILYDCAGVLQLADLQGHCPLPQWQMLVALIGGPSRALSVLRLSDQTLHDLQTFERLTWPADTADARDPL